MKIWLLLPVPFLNAKKDPWSPWRDKVHGVVVRAETEEQARGLADMRSLDESNSRFGRVWLNPAYSTCEEVITEGDADIILVDDRSM